MKARWSDPREEARRELARLLSAEEPPDVVEAALWIAREEYPDLDVEAGRDGLRALCRAGARRVASRSNPFYRLEGLQVYMFEQLGFRGNVEHFDDPRNSLLNEVLDRRLGIPLTLSIVFLELARAAGFEACGVGLPGHFVARVSHSGRTILVDPYHGGRVITEEDCRELVARSTGRATLFRRQQLEGLGARTTLGRLLLNLKHVDLGAGEHARALAAVERLLLVTPGSTREIRDKGLLLAHLGRPAAAIADLETYLRLVPEAADSASVQGRIAWLRRRLGARAETPTGPPSEVGGPGEGRLV